MINQTLKAELIKKADAPENAEVAIIKTTKKHQIITVSVGFCQYGKFKVSTTRNGLVVETL